MARTPFRPWQLRWEKEHIDRFWDWFSASHDSGEGYFSSQVGDAILDEVRAIVPLEGVAIDYGAGPGFLVEKLLRHGVRTYGVDASEGSLRLLQDKFARLPRFMGAALVTNHSVDLAGGIADLVFCIETIEHLSDESLRRVLAELNRLCRPGGTLVLTTPNDENLARSHVMCPSCGCTFHRMQHVRSFTRETLVRTLRDYGFEPVHAAETVFSSRPKPVRLLQRLKYMATGTTLPNLFYVGRKIAHPA
jgi:2-polyprenyl-3-methyl-5-hydroxy-6-metoxy-1,4-benzoquinol methylase